MIFVDGFFHRHAIWGDAQVAHLISDVSFDDLKAFAEKLRMPTYWMQPFPIPHYQLNDFWRRRAIAEGAVDCAGDDQRPRYLKALEQYVIANRQHYVKRHDLRS